MKKLFTFLMVAVCLIVLGNTANSQTLYDSYTDGDFTASPVWGGTTTRWQIVANSDVSSGATGSNTVRLNAAATATTDYLSSQISNWGTSQEWGFWIGRRAQAFTGANQQYVWLYANESNLTSATVDGYRLAIGDDSGNDDIRLEYIVNGAVSATVIASAGSFANGLTDIGLLIRVTRSSSGGWEVFTSAIPGSNGGGAIASDIPNSTNAPTSRGTATNNSLVPSSNGYVGFGALHSTGANAIIGAEFDQIYFTPGFSAPTTQATNVSFANVGNNQMDINWTNGNGSNRVVIINTSNSFTTPTDGAANPSANTVYGGSGEQVVYNNNSNTVTVTGLTAGITYWYRVYEYNGTGATSKYNGNTATNNPNSQATTGGGGLTPPELTAAVGANVDGAFIVTFVDDPAWRADILGVEIGGVELTAGFSVSAGQITFTPSASTPASLLQQSGSKNIVVIAASYNDATVTQSIAPGAATHLAMSIQPAAPATNGAVLGTQPVVTILDQYNNLTTSTADVVASVGAGTWSIGGTTTRAGVSGTATFTNLTATSDNAVTGATISFASTGLTGATSGTFDIPSPPTSGLQLSAVGTSYLIDFESTLTNVSNGAFTGAGFQLTPSAGQLSSSTFAITGFSDGDLAFDGTRTTGDYAVGSTLGGAQTGGGVYAFTGTPTNTGMGFQPTTADWTPGTVSMRVQNKTGVTATTLLISYKVHVYNDGDRSSSFNFSHSSDNASYTPVTEMNVSTPQALDASPSWRTYIRVYTVNVSLANNGLYYFRWSSDDVGGSGNRDEIVIDDFNIIVNPTSSQYPSFSGSAQDITAHGNFGLSGTLTVSGSATIANGYTATLGANNLTGTGSATIANTGTISVDAPSQISGFTTTYSGGLYLTGTNPNIPAGTYTDFRVNGGGATLTGDLVVNGTLNLNGTFTVGAHTLTISNPIGVTPTNLSTTSASSLVIDGTAGSIVIPSSVTALNNLTINNNQVVTADASTLTLSGTLTLGASAGFLNLGSNTLEIGTSTANTGDIVRNGGSIRGRLRRWFAASTINNAIFPLDNGSGAYSGANLSFTSAPSTGGTLTATFQNSNPGQLPIGPNGVDRYIVADSMHVNLINIAPQWWTITANGITGGEYSLDIFGDAISSVGDYRFITIIKRPDSGSPWAWSSEFWDATSGTNENPVLHMSGVNNGFSDFGVGGNVDNLLPVELTSFTSSLAGRDLTLNWATGTETNNAGFDVERKSTVGGWSKIGNVAGHGTVNTPNSYAYSDRNLTSGRYSYRLKQIDFNGNYKYYDLSNEVVIGTPSKYVLSQNYPNPFNPSTSISYEIPAANFVTLKIYDMMGKEVASLVNAAQEAGFYTVKFDASKLASGVYFYKLQANDFTATKKLMLMK